MANVTPQSLNSLGLYELLAEKKNNKKNQVACHATAAICRVGSITLCAASHKPHRCSTAICSGAFFQKEQLTGCCRETKSDFSLGHQPVH